MINKTLALKSRKDPALGVLALASHEDLQRLARILTHDESDGKERRAQLLLQDPRYRKAIDDGDLCGVWQTIAAEIQAFGGDTVANAVRNLVGGHTGVLYREIVLDECKRLHVKTKEGWSIGALETALLNALIELQHHSETGQLRVSDLQKIARGELTDRSLDRTWTDFDILRAATRMAPAVATMTAGFLPRVALVANPAGAIVAAGSSLISTATSAATRVTLPAILEVIRIRQRVLAGIPEAEQAT